MTTHDSTETFQLPIEAAERYESLFVPAFFAQWAHVLCRAAGVDAASRSPLLDVACGTGIVARTAVELRGSPDGVTGVDLNEAMLTVARRVEPRIDWRLGDATALPLPDTAFETTLSQMALMFFPDPERAFAELQRVTRPGGTVGILVPAALEAQAAFAPFVSMATRHAGPDAARLLSAYFACGDLDALTSRADNAGLDVTRASVEEGRYRAPSVAAFVTTEVESTPLGERIDADTFDRITRDATQVLAPFTQEDGRVEAPFLVNLVIASRG